MSRLNKVLNNKMDSLEQETFVPKYNIQGELINEKPQKRRLNIHFNSKILIVFILIVFIYVPGFFMTEKKMENKDIVNIKCNAEAIKNYNSAIKNNASKDYDGDGLINSDELKYGLNLWNPDTDDDGAYDTYELFVSKTDPKKPDYSILEEVQRKKDGNSNFNNPYEMEGVIMWPKNYSSKAHGTVLRTYNGYNISRFEGYMKFPEKGYAYEVRDGKHMALEQDSESKAWKIPKGCKKVKFYSKPPKNAYKIGLFGKTKYTKDNFILKFVNTILPKKGFITCEKITEQDIVKSLDETKTDIKRPEYLADDDYRYTNNTNTLEDLAFVYGSIKDNNACIALSLFSLDKGEFLGIVYGFNEDGDLLIADFNNLEPVGILKINERAKKIVNKEEKIMLMYYFDFEGLGFNSKKGDKICFFAASDGETFESEITKAEK